MEAAIGSLYYMLWKNEKQRGVSFALPFVTAVWYSVRLKDIFLCYALYIL